MGLTGKSYGVFGARATAVLYFVCFSQKNCVSLQLKTIDIAQSYEDTIRIGFAFGVG